MKKSSPVSEKPCPVSFALEIFGDRWTLLVLRELLLSGNFRYKTLLEAIPGIATNSLADRLKRLERKGLVVKEQDSHDARQYIYRPTQYGISVMPMLVEMTVWGARAGNGKVSREFIRRFDKDRERLIKELQQDAYERCGLTETGANTRTQNS